MLYRHKHQFPKRWLLHIKLALGFSIFSAVEMFTAYSPIGVGYEGNTGRGFISNLPASLSFELSEQIHYFLPPLKLLFRQSKGIWLYHTAGFGVKDS